MTVFFFFTTINWRTGQGQKQGQRQGSLQGQVKGAIVSTPNCAQAWNYGAKNYGSRLQRQLPQVRAARTLGSPMPNGLEVINHLTAQEAQDL